MNAVDERNLKLSVSNFGPLEHVELDLRPVTVFVGPSNTGKSFLATLIYVLHRIFCRRWFDGNNLIRMGPAFFLHSKDYLHRLQNFTREEKTVQIWGDWLNESFPELDDDQDLPNLGVTLPNEVYTILNSLFGNVSAVEQIFGRELERSFGIHPYSDLIRHHETESHISIQKYLKAMVQKKGFLMISA